VRISEICIERPVFATVMSLVLVLLGVVSYDRLTVREYPAIDEPAVSVVTSYPGASARIIESQVTQVLEGSIAGIEGIDVIESSSRSEVSRITVRFKLGVNPDVAASDVRDRAARVRGRLPDEIEEPVISKVEADAQPVMFLAFRSETLDPLALTDLVNRSVVDRLKTLLGVADVQIFGERKYAMRIWVDRERLAAYNLTVQDVEDAIEAQNVELPSGRIESVDREFSVLSRTGLTTPEEFREIIVKRARGYQVRLKDVADVALGAYDERRASRYSGQPAVAVGIIKQATANPLDVSNAVRAELPEIEQLLPPGVTVAIGNDQAVFIDRSIKAVFETIVEAIALVVLVIFFFLRTVRASIIPIVTIPVSLVATFTLMYALGFSVNTLTLLAMVLAIGLVVDDAIVVLENIFRHVEEGMTPRAAAIKGSAEIGFAVVAMTLTLAAVYAPVAFAPGRTGRLFLEFALTLAGAVLVSGFVALTLTPMMCSRLLKHNPRPGFFFRVLEAAFSGLERGYRALLGVALKLRVLVVLLAVGVAAFAGHFFTSLKSELAPTEDRGVLSAFGTAPEGATIAFTERYARQLEAIFESVSEVRGYLTVIGFPQSTNMIGYANLIDWEERGRKQQDIVAELFPKVSRIPGVQIFVSNPPSLGQRGFGRPVQLVIQTSGSFEELNDYVGKVLARAQENPGLTNLDTDLKLNAPEITVSIDRAKVADLGLDVDVIGRTLETFLGGRQVTRFERDGEQYDVMVQLSAADRATPETLSTIYVRTPQSTAAGGAAGQMVALSNVVRIEETVAPRELKRFNQLRSAEIQANLAPGYTMGEALDYLTRVAREELPATVQLDYSGQSREFVTSSQSLAFVFVLALVFIYLVLAAQFESFADPVVILLTVPLSMTGALAALYWAGGTLNVYSQIGLVTLIGLITKHGILIVEFSNQLKAAGRPPREAIIEAATLRLRPILMTTGAMVLGAVPLALATGAGAESRQQIGWVIVGGMTFGTLLTLFVVPAVLSFLGRRRPREEAHPAPLGHAPAE
jgi:multidrug efflux pump